MNNPDLLDDYDLDDDNAFLSWLHMELGAAVRAIRENKQLRSELADYKEKYGKLLDDSIKTSEAASANMLRLALGGFEKERN